MKFSTSRVLVLVVAAVGVALSSCSKEPAPLGPTTNCTVAISPATLSFGSEGGPGIVAVTTAAGCTWSATPSASWITIAEGPTGTGPGAVKYTVAANGSTQARAGTLTIGAQVHSIAQQGQTVCAYDVTPNTATFGDAGGSGSLAVATTSACVWTATTADSWLTVLSGASGQGTGPVTYAVGSYTGTAERTGVITVAGVAVRVTQSGNTALCEYQVAPVTVTPCMAGTTSTVSVTTTASCPWTANASVGWIAVTKGESGLGPGTISFSVTSNYDAPRQGLVMVRWPTPTQGQNVQVAQAGCSYAVSQAAFSYGAAGGSGTVDVYQESDPYTCGGPTQNGCVWTPASDAAWITVTNPGSHQGDDAVRFTVTANGSGTPRSGTITVRGKIITISQAGT